MAKKHRTSGEPPVVRVQNPDHSSVHHKRPRSRGGSSDPENLFVFPGDEGKRRATNHEAWHTLFANRTPLEVLEDLALWERADGSLNESYLNENMRRAWRRLFGEATPADAQRWILETFGSACIRGELLERLDGRSVPQFLAARRRLYEEILRTTRQQSS